MMLVAGATGTDCKQAIPACEQAGMMASTLSVNVSSAAGPRSGNPSRKPRCLRADHATIASAYSYLPLLTLPPEFEQFAAGLSPPEGVDQSEEGRLGLVIGLVIGLAIAISLQVWRMRRASKALLGDVDAMIPRNWLERLAVLPLCLSAGFSEELFFRLALPLLLATITGSVMVGFAASTIIFGLIHAYQGWKGVVATTLAGAFFTYVYLRTGSLIRPILLHALLDVVALIVRPVLASWLAGKHRSSSPDTCNVA